MIHALLVLPGLHCGNIKVSRNDVIKNERMELQMKKHGISVFHLVIPP